MVIDETTSHFRKCRCIRNEAKRRSKTRCRFTALRIFIRSFIIDATVKSYTCCGKMTRPYTLRRSLPLNKFPLAGRAAARCPRLEPPKLCSKFFNFSFKILARRTLGRATDSGRQSMASAPRLSENLKLHMCRPWPIPSSLPNAPPAIRNTSSSNYDRKLIWQHSLRPQRVAV